MFEALKTILQHNLLGLVTVVGLPTFFLVGTAYIEWYAARGATKH